MGEVIEMSPSAPAALVTVLKRGPIRRLTISNGTSNALSIATMEALLVALDDARNDEDCRVVVLAAAGKAFSIGHDLEEMSSHRADEDGGRAFFEAAAHLNSGLTQAIVRHPKPVIAEVAGLASEAGYQIVASCDLAIAAETATFSVPGVSIGMFCSTPMVALSRNVSRKHAMEMLLTGETIDARTAREFGLVNRVVPPEYLTNVVEKYAAAIAAKPAATVRIGKEAFYNQSEMGLAAAYDYAAEVMVESLLAPDAAERLSAFAEKQKAFGNEP